MAEERVVFGNTFAGLFAAVRTRLGPKAVAELRAAGVDFSKPLHPAYPLAVYERVLRVVCARAFPGETPERAQWLTGHAVIDGFVDTLVGKAASALASMIGTRRTLERINHSFRSSDNFLRAEVAVLAPADLRFTLNESLGMPSYYAGVFERIAQRTGAATAKVVLEPSTPPGCAIRVTWG